MYNQTLGRTNKGVKELQRGYTGNERDMPSVRTSDPVMIEAMLLTMIWLFGWLLAAFLAPSSSVSVSEILLAYILLPHQT